MASAEEEQRVMLVPATIPDVEGGVGPMKARARLNLSEEGRRKMEEAYAHAHFGHVGKRVAWASNALESCV